MMEETIIMKSIKATNSSYNYDYNRKVDKSKIPVCNILGVNIASVNVDWVVKYLILLQLASYVQSLLKPQKTLIDVDS